MSLIADFPALAVRQRSVSSMDNNVYLLTSKTDGSQLLIDAADDPAAIAALLAAARADAPVPTRLVAVVTTHSHWDHVRALRQTLAAAASGPGQTGRPAAVAGAADAAEITRAVKVAIDCAVSHGNTLTIEDGKLSVVPGGAPTGDGAPADAGSSPAAGGFSLAVIGLRGHTPGSIALALSQPGQIVHLFTGDSLFPGGVGNTGHDPDRFAQLLGDVEERVFAVYPDDTVIHPGHGRPTTLGAERPDLPAWRARGW
ncbi:MAG: MBL fold metallo-hydrolase [Propionibacteriaceae bacterium]|jgi:glyoxylase-like metal-dependent hydrolase (beta-lactamase superfamily II)|nr:MBL fold metallo-hydrolase [Propionibacteriaceae bacterium]